jgi:hypothetical protein
MILVKVRENWSGYPDNKNKKQEKCVMFIYIYIYSSR